MISYDYICQKCGELFEMWQQSSEHHEKECPECGGRLERQFPAPRFKIK